MTQRINPYERGVLKALSGFNHYLSRSAVEKSLQDLIAYRVSQINGCAFCLDMHSKDMRAAGETEQRLYLLGAWREATCYSVRERAALAWAEAVTELQGRQVPDGVYEEASAAFSDQELADLTVAVLAINSFNRINIAFRRPAGDYQPGQFAAVAH